MDPDRFEYDRNRFNLSERLVAEMFLLSYVFVFFLGETGSAVPYIWLLISIVGGISSYFIFYSRHYSLGLGLGLALGLTMPLFLFDVPLINILLFFVYVFWRIQSNFNGSRIHGWPFITVVNTLVFIFMYLLTRWVFVNDNREEIMQQQLILYLLTSFLFYFIRMITITINSRQLNNFKVREAGKVFSIIIGLGASVFFMVLSMHKPVKVLILDTMSFLFGGLTMLFGKAIDPLLEFLLGIETSIEDNAGEVEFGFDYGEREATSSIFEYLSIGFVVAALVIITVILILIKRKKQYFERQEPYYFSFKGKREHKTEPRIMLYDYSSAKDEVRKSFEQFEKEAQKSKLNRHHEETIKEWFSRMGWENNEEILSMYNAVRYGSHTPSESEQNNFIIGLENIKKGFS